MDNLEKKNLTEAKLKKRLLRTRLITAIILAVFAAVTILFTVLKESDKEVIIHGDEFLNGAFAFEETKYNDAYVWGTIIGTCGIMYLSILLVCHFIFCRFRSVEANGHYITLYRGMTRLVVYINGEEIEKIAFVAFTHVVDTKLPDGVKVCISFYRGALFIAHISFSDDNPPIDV